MSYSSGNLVVDFDAQLVNVQSPVTNLTCQHLIDILRAAEASEEGICFPKIADAAGKQTLGGGVSVGMTVDLVPDWQVKWYAGSYQATISGGNLVGGLAGNPVAYTAGVQVLSIQSANATIVETGVSGLTPEESATLNNIETKGDAVWAANFRKRVYNSANNTITIYDADGVTPLYVFDANGDLSSIAPQ